MKIKDIVLAGLITLNISLLVLVAATTFVGHEPAVQAGSANDVAGFFRMCTLRYTDNREGFAVIDTVTNRLNFYASPAAQGGTFTAIGDPIDLAKQFGHPSVR